MNFDEWEPVYEAILAEFGFERTADESVRDLLAEFAEPFDLDRLDSSDGSVVVAGAGPSLEAGLDKLKPETTMFAASTAADRCSDLGVPVDCMVTDLDKNPETVKRLSREGIPVAVHAHGDNRNLVERVVPELDKSNVLATTQAAPVGNVRNLGGFTDGDRAAFLADHCGASDLEFVGWEFDDDSVDSMKRRKLVWAERLLYWLEQRRNGRFSALDGRRKEVNIGALPVD
jgi:2-amino-4-hydroxy-6-hydroxymethyldihydropteridine diphosphokinase